LVTMAHHGLGLARRLVAFAGPNTRQLGFLLSKQAFYGLPLDRIRLGRQKSLKMRNVQVQYGSVHDMPLIAPVRRYLASGSGPD
jgi:hypothetical protein